MDVKQYRNRSETLVETVEWGGYTWRRYPESVQHGIRQYFRRSYRSSGKLQHLWLHKEVWKQSHGEIPEGYHIHHRDGDSTNNDISNLTCLCPRDHALQHPESIRLAVEHAKAWHSSEAGRAWHVKHAIKTFAARKPERLYCEHCGSGFETKKRGNTKYCSSKCRSYARKKRGDDNIQRPCAICKKPFEVNKYATSKTCSMQCKRQFMSKPRRKQPRNCTICGKNFMGGAAATACSAACIQVRNTENKRKQYARKRLLSGD